MLKTFEKSKQLSGGFGDLIEHWLSLRQELIVNYSHIAGLNNVDKRILPSEKEFSDFCTSLIDYISAGHFRIYDKIMDQLKKKGMDSTREIETLYYNIVETTGLLVEFNDKYADSAELENNLENFDEDISKVGLLMEKRFEFEDQLVQFINPN